jgi:hypothetical protein
MNHRQLVIQRTIQEHKDLAARGVRIFNLRTQVDAELHQAGMAGLNDGECAAHAELTPGWEVGKVLMSVSQRAKIIRGAIDEYLQVPHSQRINTLRTWVNGFLLQLDQQPLSAVEIDADPFLADEEYGKGFPARNRRLVALSKRREDTASSRQELEAERNRLIEQFFDEWIKGKDYEGFQVTGTLETWINDHLGPDFPKLTSKELQDLENRLPAELK